MLSLNGTSTRLIPSEAGPLIRLVGPGNFAGGTIIFLVLVIINVVVITKGGERTIEGTARFTLDALPGKQMALGANLNAGLISQILEMLPSPITRPFAIGEDTRYAFVLTPLLERHLLQQAAAGKLQLSADDQRHKRFWRHLIRWLA